MFNVVFKATRSQMCQSDCVFAYNSVRMIQNLVPFHAKLLDALEDFGLSF